MSSTQENEWKQLTPEGEWTEVKRKGGSKAKKLPAALPTTTRTRSPPASSFTSATPTTPAPTVPALVATPPVSATNKIFPVATAAPVAATTSAEGEKSEPTPAPLSNVDWPALPSPPRHNLLNPSWADQMDEDEGEEAAFREQMLATQANTQGMSESGSASEPVMPSSVVASSGGNGGDGEDGGDEEDGGDGGIGENESDGEDGGGEEQDSHGDAGGDEEDTNAGEDDGEEEGGNDGGAGSGGGNQDSVDENKGAEIPRDSESEPEDGQSEDESEDESDNEEQGQKVDSGGESEAEKGSQAEEQTEAMDEPTEDPQTVTDRLTNMLRSSVQQKKSPQEIPPVQEKPEWMQDPQWDDPLPRPTTPEVMRKPPKLHLQNSPKLKLVQEKEKDVDAEGFETVGSKRKKTVSFSTESEIRSYTPQAGLEEMDEEDTGVSAGDAEPPAHEGPSNISDDSAGTGTAEVNQPPKYNRVVEDKPAVPGALFVEEEKQITPTKARKRTKSKSRSKKAAPFEMPLWARDDEPVVAQVEEEMDEPVLELDEPKDPETVEHHEPITTHKKKARKRGGRKKQGLVGGGDKAGGEKMDPVGGGVGAAGEQQKTWREWVLDRPEHEIWAGCAGLILVLAGTMMVLYDWWFA